MVKEITSAIVKTLICTLRESKTDALCFRHSVKEITKILLHESLKESKPVSKLVKTWRGDKSFEVLDEESFIVVTVLRAGMPMLEAVMETLPKVTGGFLAMKRDETNHKSTLYYDRLPDCEGKSVILVDVMLATGGSLCDGIDIIKSKHPKEIICLNVVASPEGVEAVIKSHPDVNIYISQIDQDLNENKFIIPGLGDAGDREYNTLV
jgi:uracil phosphoribosyltransferase